MEAAAIYHRPDSEFAYLYQPDDFRVRLRTKRDDAQAVDCFYGDPYDSEKGQWPYETIAMSKIASTEAHDYWEAALEVPHKRVQYDFRVVGTDGSDRKSVV